MGSRGKYAGQPHSFACAACRKTTRFRDSSSVGRRVTLTGESRNQSGAGMNYHHWPARAVRYRCDDCGHVGWSRHPTVNHRFDREFGEKKKENDG